MMFLLNGFQHDWRTNLAAGMRTAGRGRPRSIVLCHGSPVAWGLSSVDELAAREIDGGLQFDIDSRSRVEITHRVVAAEAPGRFPTGLMPAVNGMNLDLLFDRKPVSMRIALDLVLPAGATLAFQPPPEEENNHGAACIRPPHIVNSWAVYGPATGGTGRVHPRVKLGHIYRSWLLDAAGDWTWIDSEWDGRDFAVVIGPEAEKWLDADSRAWPVRCGPNFGYESTGGSYVNTYASYPVIWGSDSTPASDGNLDTITFQIYGTSANDVIAGLYTDDGAAPYPLVGVTAEEILSSLTMVMTLADPTPVTSGQQYWFATNTNGSGFYLCYDSSGSQASHDFASDYPTLPDPTGTLNDWFSALTSKHFSIFGSYTAGGEPPAGGKPTGNLWRRRRG